MNAVTIDVSVDVLTRIDAYPHVSDEGTYAFVKLDTATFCGRKPEMFRQIAARFSEAAALLEVLNVAPTSTPDASPVQAESGVA